MKSKRFEIAFTFGDEVDEGQIERIIDTVKSILAEKTSSLNCASELVQTSSREDEKQQPDLPPQYPSYPHYDIPKDYWTSIFKSH